MMNLATLWDDHPQDITSKVTSINGKKLPALFKQVEWQPGTRNADLGAGKFDNVTEFLRERSVENFSFDPFNRSDEANRHAIQCICGGQCDTVTVANTLNILQEAKVRKILLYRAFDALRPGGQVRFLIHEGNGTGIGAISQRDKAGNPIAWQENRKARAYVDEISQIFRVLSVKSNLIIAVKDRV